MKAYIWQYVENITTQYHDGGGLLIITDRTPVEVWNAHQAQIEKSNWDNVRADLPEPDLTIETTHTEEHVFVFEDSGCC